MVGNVLVALALFSGELDVRATAVARRAPARQPTQAGCTSNRAPSSRRSSRRSAMFVYASPGLSLPALLRPRVYWRTPTCFKAGRRWCFTRRSAGRGRSTQEVRVFVAGLPGPSERPTTPRWGCSWGNGSAVPQVTEIASVIAESPRARRSPGAGSSISTVRPFYWKSLDRAPTDVVTTTTTITEQRSAAEQATALYRLTPRHALGFGAAGTRPATATASTSIRRVPP